MAIIPFIQQEPRDEVLARTYLETDVFSSLIFEETTDRSDPNVPEDEADRLPELELQTVIMRVSKSKNIIQTEVTNRPGTVKEYINDGDYTISVNGQITTEQRTVAPQETAFSLDSFLSLGQTLEVSSTFLLVFGITNVVVVDYSIAERQGARNTYDFTINMMSDEPIELEIGEDQSL